jgi:hypothetical protein
LRASSYYESQAGDRQDYPNVPFEMGARAVFSLFFQRRGSSARPSSSFDCSESRPAEAQPSPHAERMQLLLINSLAAARSIASASASGQRQINVWERFMYAEAEIIF